MATESFNNRLSYMALADMDYISARALIFSGLFLRGNAVFADAMEKQLKLFLILITYLEDKKELSLKEIRSYAHNLNLLFNEIKKRALKHGINFSEELDKLFSVLEGERERLYPEKWEKHTIDIDISKYDSAYKYFRNLNISNLPFEEIERGRQIGGFLFDSYTPEFLERLYGFTPGKAFKYKNDSLNDFDIDIKHLNKLE